MQLKTNPQGQPILHDGLPVWTDDDGNDHTFDVPQLVHDLQQLADQRDQHQHQLNHLQQQLDAYDGIRPEDAHAARQKLHDLRDKHLIDAGEVDQVRQHVQQQYEAKLDDAQQSLQQRDDQIRQLLLRHAFDASPFLRDHTLLVPDMAYAYFGDHFTVEDRDGKPTPVARLDGKPILSPNRPGQLATPEEALRTIIHSHPERDRMLTAGHPGGTSATGASHAHQPPAKPWSSMTTAEQADYIDQHGPQAAKALIDADTT